MNWKKLYRIYREEGLTVRKRGGRKRALGTRSAPMTIPQGPNQRWSLDFVSDSLLPLGTLLRNALPGKGWSPLPGALRHRRLQPGMPGRGRGHLAVRAARWP